MDVKSFILETPTADGQSSGLRMAAKRYRAHPDDEDVTGMTLLFTHCIGSLYKRRITHVVLRQGAMEPIIEHLFTLRQGKEGGYRVREAWAFDWQSHGDSAILNREVLKHQKEGISAFEWARALAFFVRSPHMKGHRIIPIGHSAGAAAVTMTTSEAIPTYSALILIEPTLVTRELFNARLEDRMLSMDFAVTTTSTRRDSWPSREAAFEYFSKRLPWGFWNPRVVRLYTEYGLENLPSGQVALKCDRKQEAVSYPDVEPHFEGVLQLGRICHTVPIHVIWGTRNDLVPEFIQESLSDVSEGRTAASITKIQDAGHMVVQEQPEQVAQAISDILDTVDPDTTPEKSKL